MSRSNTFDSQVDTFVDEPSPPAHRRRSAQLRSEAAAFLRTHAPSTPSSSSSSSLAIQRDKSRLDHFHTEAMTYILESPSKTAESIDQSRLQRFHASALTFLDRAYADDAAPSVPTLQSFHSEALLIASATRRVERDKVRLEACYRDALSFLNREAGVEELPLEDVALDRFQLQRYAREAMSFLDKAFSEDASVLVEEEREDQAVEITIPSPSAVAREEEERQIAADRAALQKYDREFDHFLSNAYESDADGHVEDAESSGNEGGLFARRVVASSHSAYSRSASASESEAFTDDEFQDVRVADLAHELPGLSERAEEPEGDVMSRLEIYEREAARYLEGVNVSEEEGVEEVEEGSDREDEGEEEAVPVNQRKGRFERPNRAANPRVDDSHAIRRTSQEKVQGDVLRQVSTNQPAGGRQQQSGSSPKTAPRPPRAKAQSPKSPAKKDLLVNLILEDTSGRSHEWSEVPLETSFYRQVPRGSTIKLRPRVPSQRSSVGTSNAPVRVPITVLERVERERDALMAALEEIINERSMLAAQVSEMKAMMQNAGGSKNEQSEMFEEDIDLAAELRDAHATMARLTEEMEATLAVLDSRYQETLRRAHRAEERCIRLETSSAQLQSEFSKQDKKLSQSASDEHRAVAMLAKAEKELESLKNKSESDLKKVQDASTADKERLNRKIQDLTDEIAALQEKLGSTIAESSNKRSVTSFRKLELEVSLLERRVEEAQEELTEERAQGRRKAEAERKHAESEKNREIESLHGQLEKLELKSKDVDKIRLEASKGAADLTRLTALHEEAEQRMAKVQAELAESKRGRLAAEAEARVSRTRYEESLKQQISVLNESGELMELRATLHGLNEAATAREKNLERQLTEFQRRAEQAEGAAANAERNAQEAAEAAKLTQDRSRQAVESERNARLTAEAQLQESKDFRAQEQQEAKAKAEATEIVKSSSRRGLRKSSSKNTSRDNAKKKKDQSKLASGSGEEAPRKKSYHRSRLFG